MWSSHTFKPLATAILVFVFAAALTNSGCSKNDPESAQHQEARDGLSRRGIPYSDESFVQCARNGDAIAVKLFLESGINVHAKNKIGETAVMAAAFGGYGEITDTLLAHGAETDVNTKRNEGQTPLMAAASNGHLDTVRALLAHGAEVNTKDDFGFTALMYADGQQHSDVVQLLINAGATVTYLPTPSKDNAK